MEKSFLRKNYDRNVKYHQIVMIKMLEIINLPID